jgi:serine/threonine-protein kinase CLA4
MSFHQVTATSLTPSRPAPQAPSHRQNSFSTNDSNSAGYSNGQPTVYSSTSSSLVNAGYKTSFQFNAPSGAGSSYATSYSGIGASPIRQNTNPGSGPNGDIVRTGWASVKEDGFAIGSLFWSRKWLVLKETTLTFHKNEVSFADTFLLYLDR